MMDNILIDSFYSANPCLCQKGRSFLISAIKEALPKTLYQELYPAMPMIAAMGTGVRTTMRIAMRIATRTAKEIATRATIVILVLALLACNAQGIMYLTSGSDAYGSGLSYPGYKNSPAIANFVASDHTSMLAPVFLGATLYRPEFANISSINRSSYYRFFDPKWQLDPEWHYSSLPTEYPYWWSGMGWEHDVYDAYVPTVKEFVEPTWKPTSQDYQMPEQKEFMQEDWEPPELSREDYPGVDNFLNSGDEPPRRPLL